MEHWQVKVAARHVEPVMHEVILINKHRKPYPNQTKPNHVDSYDNGMEENKIEQRLGTYLYSRSTGKHVMHSISSLFELIVSESGGFQCVSYEQNGLHPDQFGMQYSGKRYKYIGIAMEIHSQFCRCKVLFSSSEVFVQQLECKGIEHPSNMFKATLGRISSKHQPLETAAETASHFNQMVPLQVQVL